MPMAGPGKCRETDPMAVSGGNGLEEGRVDDRCGNALELQRFFLSIDRFGDVDGGDQIGVRQRCFRMTDVRRERNS